MPAPACPPRTDWSALLEGRLDAQQEAALAAHVGQCPACRGQLEALAADGRLVDAIVPAARMLPGIPSVYVDDPVVAAIRHGKNFPASPFRPDAASRHVKAVTRQGDLVAIGEAVLPNLYHPMVVL